MKSLVSVETTQPWITYTYGLTHDRWWPIWNSTRLLGRAGIVCRCLKCGAAETVWIRVERIGPITDKGYHPKRVAFLLEHNHIEAS